MKTNSRRLIASLIAVGVLALLIAVFLIAVPPTRKSPLTRFRYTVQRSLIKPIEQYFRTRRLLASGWSQDIQLNTTPAPTGGGFWFPQVAASGGFVHVAWVSTGVYYRRSTDGGVTWQGERLIEPFQYISGGVALAANGQVVHLVASVVRNGEQDLSYYRSADNGETWSDPVHLSNDAGLNSAPVLAVSGSTLHLFWLQNATSPNSSGDQDFYYRRSTDNGETWGPAQRLTYVTPGNPSRPPLSRFVGVDVAADGDAVALVWCDESDWSPGLWASVSGEEVFAVTSQDGGETWQPITRISGPDKLRSWLPSVGISGQNVFVIWQDYEPTPEGSDWGKSWTAMRRSSDAGVTWEAPATIDTDLSLSEYSALTASQSNLYLVMWDQRVPSGVYYLESADSGATWNASTPVVTGSGQIYLMDIAVSQSAVHVVWMDSRPSEHVDYSIFYKRKDL